MKSIAGCAFVLSLSCALIAAAPSPAPSAAPIHIASCNLPYIVGSGPLGLLGKDTGLLEIKFTNSGTKVANVVSFGVTWNGKVASIRDSGKFSPGVPIDHRFRNFMGTNHFVFSRQSKPACSVNSVQFTDGTLWTAPAATSGGG